MRTLKLLEDPDLVQANDWMRPLYIISMSGGNSDSYAFTPTDNNSKWQRVKYCLGKCWHGCTVQQINKGMREFNKYEFVRGDIPQGHCETTKGLFDHTKDREDDDADGYI